MPNHSIKMIKLRQVFGFTSLDMAHVPYLPHLVFPIQPSGSIFVFLMKVVCPLKNFFVRMMPRFLISLDLLQQLIIVPD